MINNSLNQKACSLDIENISLKRNNKILFQNFSHYFEASIIHAILGPSGSGKTSLLHAIAGLLAIDEGKITEIKAISYLFQEPRLLPWLSLEKNLSLVIEKKYEDKDFVKEKTITMLEKVRLIDYAKRFPTELSGGERQRLALARAFLYPSSLLLMDEAFQSQDIALKIELMDLLQSLHKEDKRTIILVSHDIREALSLSQSLIVFKGRPVEKKRNYDFRTMQTEGKPLFAQKKASDIYLNFPPELQEIENEILKVFTYKD